MIWICKFFPCSYLLYLHCAVIGFSKWLLFKFSITRVTRSSWFLLVCSCFKFFIKSWNLNKNENGEASPRCLGLLWDTRWVSVLVVIFPAKSLFYMRVIDGSASFGDICKDQMASVSRRVPLLLIDVLCVNSCSFHQYLSADELGWSYTWRMW